MDTLKSTQETVATMKETAKTMKQEFKNIDVDQVEDLQYDLEDLMDDAGEIQEIMGRSYGGMSDVDEDELEAELEGLEDELEMLDMGEETPSYLENDLPTAPEGNALPASTGETADDYGLTPVSAGV